jgi:Flp pilus assembly protein TadD
VATAQAAFALAIGDVAAAAAAAERAAALAPDDPRVLGVQGILARMQGDLERSRTLLERAVASAPREPGHQYELAQTLAQAGREQDAEARLRELVILQPDYAPAANDLAWLLAKNGEDLPLAEDLALRAVRALPVPEVRDTLGFVQLKRGAYDAAIQTLEGVRKERPDYSTARYHLALALAGGGRSDQAREELRAALADPTFPEADAARTELARLEQGEAR